MTETTAAGVSQFLTRGARPGEAVLDRFYADFADSDPFMPYSGFIDHTVMGAEALVGLGLGEKVDDWRARSRPRPFAAPVAGVDIAKDWQQALGRRETFGNWIAHFDRALAKRPFAAVLATWVPRLAHDPGALLFHGVIRTGHATRALEHADTPARRRELARALALWAIGVRATRPETPASDAGLETILDYARRGAAAYVRSPNIVALHSVTGPMGYMLLGKHLDAAAHRIAAAGFARSHGRLRGEDGAGEGPAPVFERAQIDALVRQRDVHAIKLTEAAFRAHQATGDPVFLRAAAEVL